MRNPETSAESGSFHIQSFLRFGDDDDNYYIVDADLSSVTVQANEEAQLSSAFVSRSEDLITRETQLYICFITAQEVQQFSSITVEFPIDQVVVTG